MSDFKGGGRRPAGPGGLKAGLCSANKGFQGVCGFGVVGNEEVRYIRVEGVPVVGNRGTCDHAMDGGRWGVPTAS